MSISLLYHAFSTEVTSTRARITRMAELSSSFTGNPTPIAVYPAVRLKLSLVERLIVAFDAYQLVAE